MVILCHRQLQRQQQSQIKNILFPREPLLNLEFKALADFSEFFGFTQPTHQSKIGIFCKKSVTFDETCCNPLSSKLFPGHYDLLVSHDIFLVNNQLLFRSNSTGVTWHSGGKGCFKWHYSCYAFTALLLII